MLYKRLPRVVHYWGGLFAKKGEGILRGNRAARQTRNINIPAAITI